MIWKDSRIRMRELKVIKICELKAKLPLKGKTDQSPVHRCIDMIHYLASLCIITLECSCLKFRGCRINSYLYSCLQMTFFRPKYLSCKFPYHLNAAVGHRGTHNPIIWSDWCIILVLLYFIFQTYLKRKSVCIIYLNNSNMAFYVWKGVTRN